MIQIPTPPPAQTLELRESSKITISVVVSGAKIGSALVIDGKTVAAVDLKTKSIQSLAAHLRQLRSDFMPPLRMDLVSQEPKFDEGGEIDLVDLKLCNLIEIASVLMEVPLYLRPDISDTEWWHTAVGKMDFANHQPSTASVSALAHALAHDSKRQMNFAGVVHDGLVDPRKTAEDRRIVKLVGERPDVAPDKEDLPKRQLLYLPDHMKGR